MTTFTVDSDLKPFVPKIIIPCESYDRIMAYTQLVDTEITGFADIDWDETEQAFVVGKVYLLEQEAHATDVEMDEETISNFMVQLIKQGVDQMPRLWWHSHVDMPVFWSGTDENSIRNFKNDSFAVSLVVNKDRKMQATIVLWKPFVARFDEVKISVIREKPEISEEIKKEVKEKVKQPKTMGDWWKGKKGKKNKGYNYGFPNYKHIKTMPKNQKEFEKIITEYELNLKWSYSEQEFLWQDEFGTERWRDPWEKVRKQTN